MKVEIVNDEREHPKMKRMMVIGLILIAAAACSQISPLANTVPTTGNTASDPSAAQQFLPNLPGYTSFDTANITSAITAAGGSGALITGNPVLAAAIAQIDGMISCYRNVGAVSARVYTENNIAGVIQGQIPKVGALAVINQDRIVNNFLSCALGGNARAQGGGLQPCAGTGSFVANGETLHYIYAASDPALCALFVGAMPRR
jgi:hypothetical protein